MQGDTIFPAIDGRCPESHPFCMSDDGFADLVATLDRLDATTQERDACEGGLAACQRDLDAIPQSVDCECDEVTRYEVPGYVWIIVGVLAATTVAAGTVAAVYVLRRP